MSNDQVFGKRYGNGVSPTDPGQDKVFGKRYQNPKPECDPQQLRSRQTLSGPQIFFFTFNNVGPNATGDNLVQLPFPCQSFFISSVKGTTEASSVFFHLAKLLKTYASPTIVATGNEPWITLNTNPATGPNYRTVIRFKEPILQYFLDVGVEGGAGLITIANVNDDAVQITGGLYT